MKIRVQVVGIVGLLALVALVLGLSSTALAGSQAAKVLSCAGHAQSKPASYVITCADANTQWTHAHWSSWTATRATGHGSR
jgi:hypothetical protein